MKKITSIIMLLVMLISSTPIFAFAETKLDDVNSAPVLYSYGENAFKDVDGKLYKLNLDGKKIIVDVYEDGDLVYKSVLDKNIDLLTSYDYKARKVTKKHIDYINKDINKDINEDTNTISAYKDDLYTVNDATKRRYNIGTIPLLGTSKKMTVNYNEYSLISESTLTLDTGSYFISDLAAALAGLIPIPDVYQWINILKAAGSLVAVGTNLLKAPRTVTLRADDYKCKYSFKDYELGYEETLHDVVHVGFDASNKSKTGIRKYDSFSWHLADGLRWDDGFVRWLTYELYDIPYYPDK